MHFLSKVDLEDLAALKSKTAPKTKKRLPKHKEMKAQARARAEMKSKGMLDEKDAHFDEDEAEGKELSPEEEENQIEKETKEQPRPMLTDQLRKSLSKQGYKLIGTHSGPPSFPFQPFPQHLRVAFQALNCVAGPKPCFVDAVRLLIHHRVL